MNQERKEFSNQMQELISQKETTEIRLNAEMNQIKTTVICKLNIVVGR
jgi:hypothetical protein